MIGSLGRGLGVATLALAGCHVVFPHQPADAVASAGERARADATPDRLAAHDAARLDLRPDAKRDAPPADRPTSDLKPSDLKPSDLKPTVEPKPKADTKPKNDSKPTADSKAKDLKPLLDGASKDCALWANWSPYGCIAIYSCCYECTTAAGTSYKIYCDLSDACSCDTGGKATVVAAASCMAAVTTGLCGAN